MVGKVMIVVNSAWNLVNFRAGLIRALFGAGYEVVAVAPTDKYVHQVAQLGFRFISMPMDCQGLSPTRDLGLAYRFWCLLRSESPAIVLCYTVKPNVYGSIAAHALGIPVINNVAGLGAAFLKGGVVAVTGAAVVQACSLSIGEGILPE